MSNALQFELDFTKKRPLEVQAKIADGMARADANADHRWKHFWDGCVLAAARKKAQIVSDDVLAEMESLPHPPGTHNLAAIGPAMKRGWKMGILAPLEGFVRSSRTEKNGNLQRLWKSKVYAAPDDSRIGLTF